MLLSFWDSMEALSDYTGGDPNRPKYYPEDRPALLDLPEEVEHIVLSTFSRDGRDIVEA